MTEPFDGSSSSLTRFECGLVDPGLGRRQHAQGLRHDFGLARCGPLSSAPNGAYYDPSLADTGAGIAAVATMAVNPGISERYFSLWLDMPSPGGKSGL